ncbi:MAG: peptide-binding protein [Elusimicrobiota bacterium]
MKHCRLILLIPLILCSCGKSVDNDKIVSNDTLQKSVPAYGDTYIESTIGDASYLNPLLATDSASAGVNNLVYNGLVKYDKDIKLVGDLAESWDVTSNGLVITFYLRKNVYWHDGVKFTAKDVVYTYNRLIDPKVRTPYGADFALVKSVTAVNDNTVRVVYKEPFAPALESWGMGIVAQHVFSNAVGEEFNNHPSNRKPVGTGPYVFKDWKTDEKIVLTYNPNYFEDRKPGQTGRVYPYFNKYVFRVIPDQSVEFLELRNESIDSMGLTPDQYNAYPEYFKKYNKFRYPSFSYTYMGYNLENPLFKDKRVRHALAYGLDKKQVIQGVLLGLGKPATGPFPPSMWAYDPEVKDYEYNPEKAKSLLAEVGWKDVNNDGILENAELYAKTGKLQPFEFTIMTNQGNKLRSTTTEIVQLCLQKLGIKVNIRIVEWSTFIHQYVDKKKFDVVILGWNLSRDPDQYSIWHSSQRKEGQYNFVGYANPEVDRLLEKGRREFDVAKREKMYRRIHAIINDDQPYCFLYYPDSLPVVHKRIQNVELAPAGIGWNFVRWYVPKSQQKYQQ